VLVAFAPPVWSVVLLSARIEVRLGP
jgi:hypothetical protein